MHKRTAVVGFPRMIAAALLAAACSDAAGPERRGPGAPLFDVAASGIALDGQSSAMGQRGRVLLKGFNPNPRVGDAIVATFFWVGPTNIVDSVTDHLNSSSFPRVGNTYQRVEYVTAGGISMATYVATNVQNVPVADSMRNNLYVVQAHLSDSVADGGVLISAWSGVDGVYAQAVDTVRSASGAGTSPTVAAPGPVPVGAGALVYAVTMSNGLVGLTPPSGFASIDPFGSISDAVLKADGRYAVPASAGPVDPRWTWHFSSSSPGTWLATVLALNPGTPPAPVPPGNLTVTTTTTGSNFDQNGYSVTAGGTSQPAAINDTVTFTGLAAGNQTVTLSGVAANCTVNGGTSRTVTVPSGGTATVTFSATCTAALQSGIAFDVENSGIGQTDTFVIKGFDPRNPRVGDAIIATVFWFGSTNIIDSVSDVITTNPYTPVGNKYELVEYVTAGGISMATYVATNVQGFPSQGTGPILAVRANFPISVHGGILISAWSGVDGVFAQAVGPVQSASGAGTSPTVAAPGAIPIGAGELAYAVTMSDGLVGLESPQGFTSINPFGALSGGRIKADGRYALPTTAGPADPRWTWHFREDAPGTWLATVLALKPATSQAPPPPVANFTFSCAGLTCNFDASGSTAQATATYSWSWGDGTPAGTGKTATHTYAAAGTRNVILTVTDAGGSSTRTQAVTVSSLNQPPTANFTFSCAGLTCSFTSTSSDPDGSIAAYSWTFGDGATSTLPTPSHTYATGDSYMVTLTVTDNQNATSAPTSKPVTVTAANQAPTANFTFSCAGLTCSFTKNGRAHV